ncbi:MAG: Terminase small subunit [Oscillospiraceae bacterium]|nr:Terminase small subunit [Oscillospiraceae bacterium]
MKKLKQKEEFFCYYYEKLQNPKEAAIKAGYLSFVAEKTAARLLQMPHIIEHIKRAVEKKEGICSVKSGLERLAFGSVCDPIKLLAVSGNMDEQQIDELDLFHISEIKKQKDGGFEIKFFDRFKALEKLLLLSEQDKGENKMEGFYKALEQSAVNTEQEESLVDD